MQCPPVEGFEPPNKLPNCKKVDFVPTKTNFDFCHSVSIIVPNVAEVPDSLERLFSIDPYYYQVSNVPLLTFLKPAFIENFVKKGELSVICADHVSECSDSFAISGVWLYLSLLKETAQRLNLRKYNSLFEDIRTLKSGKDITNIRYKLNLEKLQLNVAARNQLRKLGTFNVIVHWMPPEDRKDVCPSSIARCFTFHSFPVKSLKLKKTQIVHKDIKVPHLSEDMDEFIEWVGALSLGCNLESDDYFSTYDVPEPNDLAQDVLYLRYSGLLPVEYVLNIINEISSLNKEPWIGAYFQTFSEFPTTNRLGETTNYLMISSSTKNDYYMLSH